MKYIDINQKFTAKVAEYIAKGYTINTATMSGSQGEVAHVDLTDGNQVVRVLLDSFTEYDSFNSLSGLEIVVGAPADKVVPYDTARMISDQKNGWPFCPRCGKPLKIDPQTQRAASSNALSREVSGLYICDDCGSDEALRAFAGLPLPLEEWDQTRLINSMYK